MRDLAKYWREDYDWSRALDQLNRLEQYLGVVGGEQMHFVRFSARDSAQPFPVLLLHGWPGSFVEFCRAAPILTALGFDLIVPSLPGFAFSEAPGGPGMNPTEIAKRMQELMQVLGFARYGVQGGDWGCVIARELGRLYPANVVGVHLNCAPWLRNMADQAPTPEEERYLALRKQFDLAETGYWSIQATKPQTLCYGLHDSPLGLLAWMLEKFWAWSDHGDDLWQTFDRDELLTNVMLYWMTGSILSSARIYQEAATWWPGDLSRVTVPTGYARFPREPWGPPASLIAPFFNLVHTSDMPRGGHFAALEQPELYAQDVAAFFRQLASEPESRGWRSPAKAVPG